MTDLLARLKRLENLNELYTAQERLFLLYAKDVVEIGGKLDDEQLSTLNYLHEKSLRRFVRIVCADCGGLVTENMYCPQCDKFCTECEAVAVDLCVKCWKQPIGEVCGCTRENRLEWLQEYYV